MTTETVLFDVGGTKYKVSRSLLSNHPDTMLARSASDQWQEDPEAEIFIERDGERFRYCLDYLRDGRVILPITVAKGAVLEDLKYYGVENVNTNAIDHYPSKGSKCLRALSCLDEEIKKVEKEKACAQATLFYFKKYMDTRELIFRYSENKHHRDYTPLYDDINKACDNIETFNECLSRFGLKFGSQNLCNGNIAWELNLSKLEE